jgi:hypothetical protein
MAKVDCCEHKDRWRLQPAGWQPALQNLGGDCGCELALQNPTRTRTKLIPKREDVSFKSLIFI